MWRGKAIVTGGSSGLGREVLKKLLEDGWEEVLNFDLHPPTDGHHHVDEVFVSCDVSDPVSVESALSNNVMKKEPINLLVNNAGVNEISFLQDLTPEVWDKVMGVNAKGIYVMARALRERLVRGEGTILNITSNAAWVPMTSSLAYNASKAAAHMMTIQMAHEFHRMKVPITVFAVAPGKIAGTEMSRYIEGRVVETRGWTPEFAEQYQLASLKSGSETDPVVLAEFVGNLLFKKINHSQLAGCILPYGA